jgi:hypothetical protein
MRGDQADGTASADTRPRTRWGRVRFGAHRLPALWTAAPAGVLLAVALAAVAIATGGAGPHPAVGAIAIAALTVTPCTALVWAVIVDRETLRGATPNPEQSVESVWYDRAAGGAFTDILLITGLGTTAIAITGLDVPAVLVSTAVLAIAMGSFGIRYLVQQRRG